MDCSVLYWAFILAGSVLCMLTIITWVAHRYGQLYLHCSLIYFWVPSVVLHSDQPLSEGEIIPFSGVCQSGGGCIIHAGSGGSFTHDWQTALMCNRRRPAATSSRRASFSALASLTLRVFCIERSNIRWRICISNCRVRRLQFSGIFVALGFVGNGVITVMINSPWQADDDADNQAGDNRGDSAHTSISLIRSARFFDLQSGCRPMLRNWP